MGDDTQTHWLEPIPFPCSSYGREQVFPAYPAYSSGLFVDSFDSENGLLRFSAEALSGDRSELVRHYFTLDVNTGMTTQSDYWYRDLITQEFTDRVGITEQVFGDGEDFSTVYVSPDRTKILYRVTNPERPDCAHGCVTETLWIADSNGNNPITLAEFYGRITRIVWDDDGMIYLSLSPLEVWEADFTLAVNTDGTISEYADEMILEGRSLPFEYVRHMPIFSPNREWIAVTMGSEQLYSEGMPSTGFILNAHDDRYIQLPYNGQAASPILWIGNNEIAYPVIGLGWDGEDYDLPSHFYAQDALWRVILDFDTLSYLIGDGSRLTNWVGNQNDLPMLNTVPTHHILLTSSTTRAIIYSDSMLALFCYPGG
jgi:hypothetical protein